MLCQQKQSSGEIDALTGKSVPQGDGLASAIKNVRSTKQENHY